MFYHRSQLSSWVASHTVDMAGGPFLFPSRCLSMNGTAQQSCGHAAVAMASGDAFPLCDTVVLWIFGHVLLLSVWVISTLCFLWEKKVLLNAGSATWGKHVKTSYASPSSWRDSCGEKLPTLCPAVPRRETQHLGEFCWPSWIIWQKTYNGLDGNSYMEVSMMDRDWSKDWFWIYWGQTIQWIMKRRDVSIIYSGNLCRFGKTFQTDTNYNEVQIQP